jgi:hypothetical protein
MPLSEFASGGAEELMIVRRGDEFHVTGVLDLGLADVPEGDPQFDQIGRQALESAEIRFRITFPGRVISANGEIDGNSVTWRPDIGERTEMRAVGSAIADASNLPVLVGVVVALLLAVGAALIVLARRRREPIAEEVADDAAELAPPVLPSGPSAQG